jgi:hypothetical protein
MARSKCKPSATRRGEPRKPQLKKGKNVHKHKETARK